MTPAEIVSKAVEMGVDINWAKNCRIRYLLSQNYELVDENTSLSVLFALDNLGEIVAIKESMRRRKIFDDDEAVTDEMIAQAKAYPIEKLINFVRGSAIAFCHDDKSPSLTWDKKRNRAKCWPCDKSFDSIDVLVQRDGFKFKEAVRELERR